MDLSSTRFPIFSILVKFTILAGTLQYAQPTNRRLRPHMANDNDDNDHDESPPSRIPRFLPGNRQVSLAALQERIEEEFVAETTSRPDILLEAAADTERNNLT